jgi:hypothetical protein
MKKLFTLLVITAMTISIFAQSPQKMSYQCVLRNASGALVTNQVVGIKISILQGSASGTAVYTETLTPTTNPNGLVSIEIGGGTGFDLINWSAGPYFLKTETDPTGGTSYTITGTSQLLSVPYAFYAKIAKTADYNDITNKPILFDGTWTSLTGKPSFSTVATSGSYNDLINKPTLFDGTWISLTGKPSTLAGYGITDGMSMTHVANGITSTNINNWNTAYSWGNHAGLYRLISYVPSWTEITSTIAGYGITDAVTTTGDQTIAGNKTFTNKIIVTQQGIGTSTPNASSALEISSTTQGFLPPRMTQVQRDVITPVEGLIVYNTTTKKPNYYDGTEWENYDGTIAQTLTIGVNFRGGKVAYILQPGDPGYVEGELHGLIAAPSDQSSALWGCAGTPISGADGTAIGTGNQNTIDIMTGCSTLGIAARLCGDLELGGYSDWYLPSRDELNKLYLNKVTIGGFSNGDYWSSSERMMDTAWIQGFLDGTQGNNLKSNMYRVRAIRSF